MYMYRRARLLKELNTIILQNVENEETIINTWFSLGIPDEATNNDYEFIAESDESFNEIVDLFASIIKEDF